MRKLIEMSKRTKQIDFENPKDIEFLLKEISKTIYNSGIVIEINEKRFKDINKKHDVVVDDLNILNKRITSLTKEVETELGNLVDDLNKNGQNLDKEIRKNQKRLTELEKKK